MDPTGHAYTQVFVYLNRNALKQCKVSLHLAVQASTHY